MNTAPPNDLLWLLFCVAIIMVSFIYWVPSFIAFARRHPKRWLILLANLLFGCTIVGWFVTLVWACSSEPELKN